MSTDTGSSAPIRANKGDILIFKVDRPIDIEGFAAWAAAAAEQMKQVGITAVFINDKVDLYAAVGE